MPNKTLIEVCLLFALLAGAYWFGAHNEKNACIAGQVNGIQVAQVVADKESTRKETVGTKREVARERIRTVYVKIKEEAQNNVEKNADKYAGCGLDDDGLHIWNAANAGRTPALRGESGSALPGTATGAVGDAARPVPEPPRRDGVGAPVPRSVGDAGGM